MTNELRTNEELNEEFVHHLTEIQPYLSVLKSINDVKLCHEWLHKLYRADEHEITLRNAYLAKLLDQLKNDESLKPFNKLPKDNESLLPMYLLMTVTDNKETLFSNAVHFSEICETNRMIIVDQKGTENNECIITECLNKTEAKDDFNIKNKLINYIPDTMKEIQIKNVAPKINFNTDQLNIQSVPIMDLLSVLTTWQNTVPNNSEGGDGLTSKNDTNKKLESIEKMFEELKIKNDFLADQVKLHADINKKNNDYMSMVNVELQKVKNGVEVLCQKEATKETNILSILTLLTDKITDINDHISHFTLEATNLKAMVQDACGNKKIIEDTIEILDYMKEKLLELQRSYDELKAYSYIKNKEIDALEERSMNQKLCMDTYVKSMKNVEKYITDKLSIIIPYILKLEVVNNQLDAVNKKQKKILLQLAEKLEEMDKPSDTKEMQDMIKTLDKKCKESQENLEKFNDEDILVKNINENVD